MGQASILPVSYSAIRTAANFAELIAEYASECAIEEIGAICPNHQMYEKLEAAGVMHWFGVYEGSLVGFASLLVSVVPHYSVPVATVESIFLSKSHRTYGVARALLAEIEERATVAGCTAILYSAPFGGRFERLLSLLEDYRVTNAVFCRRLA